MSSDTRMALDLPVPEATETQHIGRNWQAPPPRRMWQEEIGDPRLFRLYVLGFVLAVVLSMVFGSLS